MFSVTLDEAIGMRRAGRLHMAYQLLAVTPALCSTLTCPLMSLLRAMTLHARHFGTTPSLASLDPHNFQRSKSQRVARSLLTRRSQFLHKISTQLELTEELGESFLTSVKELDASHYDRNTCLRESVVLRKCFLLARLISNWPSSRLHSGRKTRYPAQLPECLPLRAILPIDV